MNIRNYTVPALAALLVVMSACAQTGNHRSTGQAVDDGVVAARAKTALIENKDTKAHKIDVEVRNGEVQLNGFVTTAQEKADAAATVRRVAGVREVRNNLQIQAGQRTGGEVVDDAVITTKVKAALIADTRTKSHQIEVSTNKGEVQLGGFVDSREAKKAASDIVSSITGVKSVSNDLQVKGN